MLCSWSTATQRTSVALALAAVLTLAVSGCGSTEAAAQGVDSNPAADSQGGAGLPMLRSGEQVEGAAIAFEGTVAVSSDGCMRVLVSSPEGDQAARWAVWPAGSELYAPDTSDPSSARVGGETFSDQDRVSGTAQLVTLADLPDGDRPGAYFEGRGRYCDAQESGVIVISEIAKA